MAFLRTNFVSSAIAPGAPAVPVVPVAAFSARWTQPVTVMLLAALLLPDAGGACAAATPTASHAVAAVSANDRIPFFIVPPRMSSWR